MRWVPRSIWIFTAFAGIALALPAAAEASRVPAKEAAGTPSKTKAGGKGRRPGRMRQFARDTVERVRGARQHKYMPLRKGSQRTIVTTTHEFGGTRTGTQVERVTAVQRRGGLLRAQMESTWSSGGHTNKTQHVTEVGRKGVRMSIHEKLDSPPSADTRSSGVALPRRLRVGKTWSNSMSSSVGGHDTTRNTSSRVTGRVTHRGPDGRTRTGFVVESVTHTRLKAPDGTVSQTTSLQRSIHVKGLGEVESRSKTDGQAGFMTRRLVSTGRDGN
jgi:hypothetical protein